MSGHATSPDEGSGGVRTAEEHLAWARARADKYLAAGYLEDAVYSMCSDLLKHPEFAGAATLKQRTAGLRLVSVPFLAAREVQAWLDSFKA